jgi:GNAT superfamily N-acetyltransferase
MHRANGKPGTARLRHLYVASMARKRHVGQTLVEALVKHAALHFWNVRLSTDTIGGDAFYVRCGFMRVDEVNATHILELVDA